MAITGTNSPETLTGTLGDDVISALGGNDTINVTQGADSIDGGAGTDRLSIIMGDITRFAQASEARTYTLTSSSVTDSLGILSSRESAMLRKRIEKRYPDVFTPLPDDVKEIQRLRIALLSAIPRVPLLRAFSWQRRFLLSLLPARPQFLL